MSDTTTPGNPSEVTWIGRLIRAADEVGGVDLPIPGDTPATAADFAEFPETKEPEPPLG